MMRIQAASNLTLHQVTRQFRVQRWDDPAFFPEWREGLADLGDRDRLALDDLKADYLHLAQYTLQEPLVKMVVIAPLLKLAGFYRSPFYLAAEKSVEIHTPVDPPDLPPHDLGDLHDPQRLDGPTNGPTDQPGNSGTIIRGRIAALVFVPEFWVLAIEAKRSQYSLEVGIPRLLAYMLDAPQRPTGQPVWGLVTNGREFQFMKVQAACAGEGWEPNPDGPNPDGARGEADPTGRSPVPPSDSPDPSTIYALSDLFSIYRGRDLDWVLQILRRIAAVYQSESASITPTP